MGQQFVDCTGRGLQNKTDLVWSATEPGRQIAKALRAGKTEFLSAFRGAKRRFSSLSRDSLFIALELSSKDAVFIAHPAGCLLLPFQRTFPNLVE